MQQTKTKRTRRRGNGEGSIHQRPDGRWVAMLSVGRNGEGKRKRRAIYGWVKQEVQDELAKLQNAKIDGVLCSPSKLTVAKLLHRWLETRSDITEGTAASYKNAIEKHISPRVGGIGLQKLTPLHVQSMHSDLRPFWQRSGCCPADAYRFELCLKASRPLGDAATQRVRCGGTAQGREARYSFAVGGTSWKLLATAEGDRLEALYVLAVGTGMRLGELFGLQWANVDLKAGTVTIRHTLQELDGKLTLKEPKTDKSRRCLRLAESAVTALAEHRKRALAGGLAASPWVFGNRNGGPLRRGHFHQRDFKPLLKRAELPDIHFHGLRHTSATLLLSAGVHPKIVQERLGHSQISMTLDTYSHVLQGMDREAADKLDAVLNAARKLPAAAATA